MLSDFPALKVIRSYGVLAPNEKDARRALRQKWIPGDTTFFPSEMILAAVQALAAR